MARHPILMAFTGLRLRFALRREGNNFREINSHMAKFNSELFDQAVAEADAMTESAVSAALAAGETAAKAIGDGGIIDWFSKFLDSELGKLLIQVLMALLTGLIGVGSIAAGLLGVAKGAAKAVLVLAFVLFAGFARAADADPPPVTLDPPAVVKVAASPCPCQSDCGCTAEKNCGFVGCPSASGIVPQSMPAASSVTYTFQSSDPYDALDMVNAKRAARGLRPYLRDEGLFQAAKRAASFRARLRLFGHTSNDFAFASGVRVDATGCAAYQASYGFMACAVYDNYTSAGAAWVPGPDGRMYSHLFVKYGPPDPLAVSRSVAAATPAPSAVWVSEFDPRYGTISVLREPGTQAAAQLNWAYAGECANGVCTPATVVTPRWGRFGR